MKFSKIYRPEIDGLRGIAVIAVIINHFSTQILPSGYLGVDIFFVISGYVITKSLLLNLHVSFQDFLLSFYSRRIKRIIPALGIFLILMSIVVSLLDPNPKSTLNTAATAIFGFSNIYLWHSSVDYFSQSTETNAFMHTWSLGVEEQFYFIYPIILFSFFNISKSHNNLRSVILFLGFLCLLSLSLLLFINTSHTSAAYYLLPTRFWEIGTGCLISIFIKPDHFNKNNFSIIIAFISLILIFFIPTKYTLITKIFMVYCVAYLIYYLNPSSKIYNILSHRVILYIGLISYSMYLWHWGIIYILRMTLGINYWSAVVGLILIFSIASISYYYIEKPFRNLPLRYNKRNIISCGMIVSISIAISIVVLSNYIHNKISLTSLLDLSPPSHIVKTWWRDDSGLHIDPCHAENIYNKNLLNRCFKFTQNDKRRIYLIGDSHARNYLSAVKEVFKNYEISYLTMGWGCAFLPDEMSHDYVKVNCPEYVRDVKNLIFEIARRGDIVFIGQRLFELTNRNESPEYINFIKDFARDLLIKNTYVVLLDGTYPPDYDPALCYPAPWRYLIEQRNGCFIEKWKVEGSFKIFDELAFNASKKITNLFYSPLRTGLCIDNICGQKTIHGNPIWHDRGHITELASSELGSLLKKNLEDQGFISNF